MFCRFGSTELNRPVAATVCSKVVWMRSSDVLVASISVWTICLSLLISRWRSNAPRKPLARSLSTDLTYRSCNAAAFVVYEPDLVRLVGFKPISSNSTFCSCLGLCRLISMPAYSQAISCAWRASAANWSRMETSRTLSTLAPVRSMPCSTRETGSSIARISQHCSRSSIIGPSVTARLRIMAKSRRRCSFGSSST